jgi:integrase
VGRYPALALLDGKLLLAYKNERLHKGFDSDTTNRHFSILRVYNRNRRRLGGQHPNWKQLFSPETENPECIVTITDDMYRKLCLEASKVGLWLRTLSELACNFGWRLNAWRNLKVSNVDMLNCCITLPGALSKNGEPYSAYLTEGDNIYQLLKVAIAGKQPDDYVLTRQGKPLRDIRHAWLKITSAAGIPPKAAINGKVKGQLTRAGIRFHNTRNTAATRMIEAGAAEVEAMDIGGWKTRSIFEHYHITDETAKKRIAQKMAKPATSELTYIIDYR